MAKALPGNVLAPADLLLSRSAALVLRVADLEGTHGARGLAELARRVSDGGAPISLELLVVAAHLQAALTALVQRFDKERPGALSRARRGTWELADLPWRLQLGALEDSADGRLTAVLVLDALRENPALAPLSSLWADAVGDGASDPDLEFALGWLRDDEAPLGSLPSLPALLRAPAAAAPLDLDAQLGWLATSAGHLLPPELRVDLLRAGDRLREAHRPRGGGPGPPQGPGLSEPPPLPHLPDAEVAFTADRAWMPKLVLLAKQTRVWLHQLSASYARPVITLADVPDAELDVLAARGFTGLWLIGVWERAPASRQIKRLTGNPEAEASAYAVFDYVIAEGLGGEAAFLDLKVRALHRGIRLASDMVPNHVGLDGRWVIEHPERFVQCAEPPYPGYRFTGPDLSGDPRVALRIEDGYWNRRDAAVVFERRDTATGEARYLYHGNDGTQMPWNDTAQLDYLRADTREAVIQEILGVARRFSVIRFDAAMTLARRHIQRLWHPVAGQGGAVPSRSERGVSPEDLARLMPTEFWREVVDRVQEEVPDTLLLAEAFWMMEGYFVRNLGMHRVYNSAFMHMLRDEDNAGFGAMLAETLASSPEVLYRFVNFMNNPDEEPAAEQFGTTGKYFAVATVLATLPGLPMFGHGQAEGLREKYGMEYARAYRDEAVDEGLLAHHEGTIFPLLRRRADFAGVEGFALFPAEDEVGSALPAVLAYSNVGPNGARSLVVVHNGPGVARGRVHRSAPARRDDAQGAPLEVVTLGGALGLPLEGEVLALDARSADTLRCRAAEVAADGLWFVLGPYEARVWMGWEAVERIGGEVDPAPPPAGTDSGGAPTRSVPAPGGLG